MVGQTYKRTQMVTPEYQQGAEEQNQCYKKWAGERDMDEDDDDDDGIEPVSLTPSPLLPGTSRR